MISLIFPAYNEEGAIAETLKRAHDILRNSEFSPFEIIVVDDGSDDQTSARAAASKARVVRHLHNLGYGRSLKDGIKAAKYDTVVICDADGTYPLERIPDLIREYNKGYDMVVGSRKGNNLDPFLLKRILRWFLKLIVEFTAGRRVPDINSGLRVFSKKTVMPYFPTLSNAFSFTTSVTLAYFLDLRFISYVPVDYLKRVGSAKVRLGRDILRTLQYITEVILFYNPLKVFLFISMCFFLASAVAFATVCWCGSNSWSIPVGLGLLFMSFLSFLFGLISVQLKHILHSLERSKTNEA